jgi:hypothetical protein
VDQNATDASTYYLDCDGDDYAADTVASRDACMPPADSAAVTACNRSTASWTDRAPLDEDSTDCFSSNANVYPNQTQYFATTISNRPSGLQSHDYNCDGVNSKFYTTTNVSSSASCPNGIFLGGGTSGACREPLYGGGTPWWGWTGSTSPACGSSASFTTCTYSGGINGVCPGTRVTRTETQTCR